MRKTVSSVIGVFAATSARPCPWNHARRSVSDHRDRQAGARPVVEDLSDRRLQVEVIDRTVRVRRLLASVVSGGGRAHHLLLSSVTEAAIWDRSG